MLYTGRSTALIKKRFDIMFDCANIRGRNYVRMIAPRETAGAFLLRRRDTEPINPAPDSNIAFCPTPYVILLRSPPVISSQQAPILELH